MESAGAAVTESSLHESSFRAVVRDLTDYEPGRDVEEVAAEYGIPVQNIVKLASNENPFGPSPKALEAIPSEFPNLHMYPWKRFTDFKEVLAEVHGLNVDGLVLGHGTESLIATVPQLYINAGDEVVVAAESYTLHELSCVAMNAVVRRVPLTDFRYDLDGMLAAVGARTKIVWLCNPNNPTGTILSMDDVQYLLDRIPETVAIVMDGAYAEYADDPDYGDGLEFVRRGCPNVIALRTLSKAYGLAGLRVGFAAASPTICRMLDRLREPFNLSRLATAAGPAAVTDFEWLQHCQRLNAEGRDFLSDAFARMGFAVVPSQSNFILVDVEQDAEALFERLMAMGIIVRPAGGWGFDHHIRVTVGTKPQNEALIAALKDILAGTEAAARR